MGWIVFKRAGLAGLALTLFLNTCLAQEDYYPKLEQTAFEELNAGNYAASLEKSYQLYAAFPDKINAHMLVAFNLMNLGRHKDAVGYVSAALGLDPSHFSAHCNAGYYYALEGDLNQAKAYLTESIKLYPRDIPVKETLDEIRKVGSNTNKAVVFNQLADWYEAQFKAIKDRDPSVFQLTADVSKDVTRIRPIADSYVTQFTKLNWPEMALATYGYACQWLRGNGYMSEALDAGQTGFNYYRKNGYGRNPVQAAFMLNELVRTYYELGNDEKVVDFMDEILTLSEKLPVHTYDVNALILAASSFDALGNNDESRRLAGIAYKLAEQSGNRYGATSAANSLCAAYNQRRFDTDVNDAIYYGEQALQVALKFKFEALMGPILGNLALAYYKLGTRAGIEKCITLYGQLRGTYELKEMWNEAASTTATTGIIMYHAGDFQYAAKLLEEAIGFSKKGMGIMRAEDKLTYYQSTMSAYEFLAASYAQLGNAEKAYEAIEGSRSRVLTERLAKGKEVKPGTIADVQSMLAADEAAVFYSLFSAHEVIILVITKKYSKVLFHKDETFIGNIKEKYLDRMNKEHGERKGQEREVAMADFQKVTQLTRKFFEKPGIADEVLKEYLQGYYKFLILPVLNRLGGIKNLLVSADDVLNYIPFEALQTHNGKYLVETYGIRYLNSTGALRLIEDRKYGANRKPLVAMGGAVYERNNAVAPVLKTQHDLNLLSAEVEENKKNGTSQRKPYAALFGNDAMSALPGTLEEVKSISKNVPGSEVYSGTDFTENRLKTMSGNGSLKQFKVLHLATHGFVVEDVPDLSGVAMSIFSNEQGGEDGFLNVNEIAALNLNTDLAVLSACQTALGKIYNGEGITGLTQSLMIAGSNAALVSLWPVNDTSTMLFMTDLYKEASKGKNYAQVVTELKRRFIKGEFGEQFKHPNYWAPFVYFGK